MLRNRARRPATRGALYYFVFWAAIGVYMPFINVYFAQLGLRGSQIGLLNALLPLMTLSAAPALAALGDRRGVRVRILMLALAAMALMLLLLSTAHTLAALAPLMLLFALARSPVGPIGDSLIARMAARHRLDFGGMRLWGSLGFAVIAISAGALWQRFGYSWMFVAAAAALVPALLLARLLEEGPVIERAARRPFRDVTRDRGLIAILAATFLIGGSLGMDGGFQGIYVAYLDGGGLLVGGLFSISAFSELPAMHFATALARRLGVPGTLLLTYGLLGINYIGFALAGTPLLLVPLTIIKGVGFGVYFANTVRMIDERTPPEWASTIQALMNAGAGGLAPLVASLLGGSLLEAFGPRAIYIACSITVLLAMLVLGGAAARGVFRSSPPLRPAE
ncbi:MAG: MFS transporter [Kouleothrix sp.]|nr:MFS transporter [Kouleothrix sp.]